jgi:5-oxoprolinase (ATP-hydrolysing) subunit A
VLWEIFADLDYDDEGRCIITREHAPVAPEQAVARITGVLENGHIRSINGKDVPTRADTICVHSDTPGAVEVAKAVYAALKQRTAPHLVQNHNSDERSHVPEGKNQ